MDPRLLGRFELDSPMNSAPVADVVEHAGGLGSRLFIGRLGDGRARIGDSNCNHVLRTEANGSGDVKLKRGAESVMFADTCPVDENGCSARHAAKAQGNNFAFPIRRNVDGSTIPGIAHIVIPENACSFTKALCLPTAWHLN